MRRNNVSFHESVLKDKTIDHSSSLIKSGENDNNEEIKININEAEEEDSDTIIKTSTDGDKESVKKENKKSDNSSSDSKSSLQLKTGLVDSPFITPTQNILLKCWRRSKVKSIRRNMKNHLKALEVLANKKKRNNL